MVIRELQLPATVVVFDLDDTLYPEAAYQLSGFREICRYIEDLCGQEVWAELEIALSRRDDDILGRLCKAANLPVVVKQSLLWVYRLHLPDISLDSVTHQVLLDLEKRCRAVAILTDGRSVTQRLKIKSLDLLRLPLYISEEYGDEKPSENRFVAVMNDFPADHYVYVGDNPNKDFIAPNSLEWLTIGLRGNAGKIHHHDVCTLTEEQSPRLWIRSLAELIDVQC